MVYDPLGISSRAVDYVRERAESIMGYYCKIERVKPPGFDNATHQVIPGQRTTIYEGRCRVWEVSGGAPVMVAEDEVTMQTTNLSLPWDISPVPERDDEVTITASDADDYMIGKRFVIDSSAKAGELRATRRFLVRGYQKP